MPAAPGSRVRIRRQGHLSVLSGAVPRLRAVSRRFNFTLARRATIISEHRELIHLTKVHDADKAAETIARHVEGSGRHVLEQMRARDTAMID